MTYTYNISTNSWTAVDKLGTTYTYGVSASSRQDNPSDSSQVYKWMIDEVKDTNSNKITYQYSKSNGVIFPNTIFYSQKDNENPNYGIYFISSSKSAVKSYKTGFPVIADTKITEINVSVQGKTRKNILTFKNGNNGRRILLDNITAYIPNQTNSGYINMPPAVFNYSVASSTFATSTNWTPPYAIVNYVDDFSLTDHGIQYVDVNGDGLTDILQARQDQWHGSTRHAYINNGNGGYTEDSSWNAPVDFTYIDISYGGHDQGSRIADLNGDGLPDIIHSMNGNIDPKTVWINTGSGFVATSSWNPPVYFTRYNANEQRDDAGARIVDINGDGLADIIQAYEDYNEGFVKNVWLNDGSGFVHAPNWTAPTEFMYRSGFEVTDRGVRIADINGDGLVDLLRCGQGMDGSYFAWSYINTGHSFIEDAIYKVPAGFIYILENASADFGGRLMDINGDGINDYTVYKRNPDGSNGKQTAVGTGYGFSNTNWNFPVWFTEVYKVPLKFKDKGVRFADINSDSITDIVQSYDTSTSSLRRVFINQTQTPVDLLTNIQFPQGASTTIAYKPSTQYISESSINNPALPLIIQTVSSITTYDGLNATSTIKYDYAGGSYYFNNPTDKKFAGFSIITETDPVGNITKTYYHQGSTTDATYGEYADHISKVGKPYRIEKYDNNGNLFEKTINKWENYDRGYGSNFVALTQTIDSAYDGLTTHKDKAEQYIYDTTTGNLTQKTQYGEVLGNEDGTLTDTGTDKYTTTYSYAASAGSNIKGLPSQELVVDQNSNKVKETKYFYDNLNFGEIDKGNETKREQWKSGTSYITTQKEYNSFGLVTEDIDTRGKINYYDYDSYNLFVASTTNPLSQQTFYTYDYLAGKPKQITDSNGNVFQNVYDGLGRVVEQKQPDITNPFTLVTKTAYIYNDVTVPSSIKKTHYLSDSVSGDEYSYFDGFGRMIQQKKLSKLSPLLPVGSDPYSTKDWVYDARGLVTSESVPYYTFGSANTSRNTSSDIYTNYTYDPLGRVLKTLNVLGDTTNIYANWKVTTVDARSKPKDFYNDAYGNLIQVYEHNNGSTYSTKYTYNGLGNLTKIIDANGNIRNFTYDGLGRRLTSQDLHSTSNFTQYGKWTYTYDDAGNIISVIDPKHQIPPQSITYTYDDLNRLVKQTYFGNDVQFFTYDNCTNGIGHICKASTTDAVLTYQYDPLGNVKQETKNLWYNFNNIDYVTQYEHDRQGNVTLITYPDYAQVQYGYHGSGLLQNINKKEANETSFSPLVYSFDYTPVGQTSYTMFANGVEANNGYNINKLYRLEQKSAFAPNDGQIQNVLYEYDHVGNITKISDTSSNNSAKIVDYTYDDLNRLLTASTTNVANGQDYYQGFTYDAIGNITNNSAKGNYGYTQFGFANPHAVISIDTVNYTYDKNGNLIGSSDGLINEWDINNQLTYSANGFATTTYAYDANGNRVKYNSSTIDYVYPNQYFSRASTGSSTKNIYAKNQLVATVEANGLATTTHYIITDHLSGSSIVTDESGNVVENLDYYPYGEIRIDNKTGLYDERKKFTGHEFDVDTGYNYMGARYYDGRVGRFTSQDPAFLAVGNEAELKSKTGLKLQQYLADPQGFNSYAYARNNPLRMVDPSGEWYKEFFWDNIVTLGNGQSWSSFQAELGQAANQLSQDSAVWNAAISHPIIGGAAVGVGSGAAAYGASAGLTYLSTQFLGGLGTGCLAFCDKISKAEYRDAIQAVSGKFDVAHIAPTRAEISQVYDQWANTNMGRTTSIVYHYAKHAGGNSLQQLTQNGINVWNSYMNGSGQAAISNLANGDIGLKITMPNGAGGIYTFAGQIVTTWFK